MRLVSTSTQSSAQAKAKPSTFFQAIQRNTAEDGFCYIPDPVACFRDIPLLLDMEPEARQQQILRRLLDDEWHEGIQSNLAFLKPQNHARKLRDRLYLFEAFGDSLTDRDLGARLWVAMMLSQLQSAPHQTPSQTPNQAFHALTAADDAGLALAFALADHPAKEGLHLTLLVSDDQTSWADRARINRLCQGRDTHVRMFKMTAPLTQIQQNLRQTKLPAQLHLIDGRNIAFAIGDALNAFEAFAQLRAQDHRGAPVIGLPWTSGHPLFGLLLAKEVGLPLKALAPTLHLTHADQSLDEALKPHLDDRIQAMCQSKAGFFKNLRLTGLTDATLRQAQWELHMDGCLSESGTALGYGGLESKRGLGETALLWASRHPLLEKEHFESRMNLTVPIPEGFEGEDQWEHIPRLTGGVADLDR